MPDDQSAVGFAFEAGGWLCWKFVEIDQVWLVSARLKHLVSATEDVAGRHFLSGLTKAATSADSNGIKVENEGEWNARTPSFHTCKHVLPGKGLP